MRIAMVSNYLPSGSKIGVGYQAHELATELVRRGHDVDMVSACGPVPGATYRHRHVAMTGPLRTFRFATAVRRLPLDGYDVVHAHGDDYWLWRRRAGAHIRTMHGSCFEEARVAGSASERVRMLALGVTELLAAVVADRTVLVSPQTRRWLPWVRTVVPNGVDGTRFHPGGERAAAPVVLFVGTWSSRKRGELLAAAFVRDVLPALPDAQLWMVCDDVPGGVHPAIRGLGRVGGAELAGLYRLAWVFCLPSSYEGFGIPYVEAMLSGLPVLATPNAGARFVTGGGRAGRLVDAPRLGPALAELLGDRATRDTLAALGLERAAAFELGTVVDRYEQVYREAMAGRVSRGDAVRTLVRARVRTLPGATGVANAVTPRRRRALQQRRRIDAAVPGSTVLRGPFVGMQLGEITTGSHVPKRLGCYELELHGLVTSWAGYDCVVEAGCGEGWYVVGLARRLPDATVWGFDTSAAARAACAAAAARNGVRVRVGGAADPARLQQVLHGRALLIVDIEGGEVDLLDPALTPALSSTDVLVELHDFLRPGATGSVLARFPDRHAVFVDQRPRDPADYPELAGLAPSDRSLALDESRPPSQRWVWLAAPGAAPAAARGENG